jgi:hypothetical protein
MGFAADFRRNQKLNSTSFIWNGWRNVTTGIIEAGDRGARVSRCGIHGDRIDRVQCQPRSTHDIDLVVILTPFAADLLAKEFPLPDFYLDPMAAKEAIKRNDMFNLLDITGGDKVDFWMLRDHPFDHSCFARRYAEEIAGVQVFISRPEDTILQKLRWSEMSGGSEKQFRDSLRVYEVQFKVIDQAYLNQWADSLGIRSELDRLRAEAIVQ